jgi:hypothetical protein
MDIKVYKEDDIAWPALWTAVNSREGFTVPGTSFSIRRNGDQFYIMRRGIDETLLRVITSHTMYCCGVMQVGNFWEVPNIRIPMKVKEAFMSILYSACHSMFRKGIVQGWFYKPPRTKKFEHPIIMKMFKSAGMRKFGKESFNPNSGNNIQGYQVTISKEVARGNS